LQRCSPLLLSTEHIEGLSVVVPAVVVIASVVVVVLVVLVIVATASVVVPIEALVVRSSVVFEFSHPSSPGIHAALGP
jgi:hypothetical protein